MKTQEILVKNGLVKVNASKNTRRPNKRLVGTLLSNLLYLGYIPSNKVLNALQKLSRQELTEFWENLEPVLKKITGADKEMDSYVVYQNFPQEVLEKSEAEYWIAQIFMYFGVPNDWFTQPAQPRDKMFEETSLKVLQLADKDSFKNIYASLSKLPVRWTEDQFEQIKYLVINRGFNVNVAAIPFKENLVQLLKLCLDRDIDVELRSAMDVLRLGVALSDGDVTFKTKTKFKNFKRKERKFFLRLLNSCSNLEEDFARDKNLWKTFVCRLHPGDYPKFPNVVAAYNKLYNNEVQSFNSLVNMYWNLPRPTKLFNLLKTRPGVFARMLNETIQNFGEKAAKEFTSCVPALKTSQLLKLQGYLNTINYRNHLLYPPKGNWSRVQMVENKTEIPEACIEIVNNAINKELKTRLNNQFKSGVCLQEDAEYVKLQTSDSELTNYGRGTVFPIPENIKFIRSSSYWKGHGGQAGNLWYDNGWNLFQDSWAPAGNVCWNATKFGNGAAVFSGDPTNSKTKDGDACQMIDLYIDKLLDKNVRYAVWNVLCFNHVCFDEAEVFGALQWGEEPQKGKLFEPSRCQFAFPLKGKNLTKYVAYLDFVDRKLVYMDANLKGEVSSAVSNARDLSEKMPAFIEYLDSLPSVHDLFANAKKSSRGPLVTYSDKDITIKTKKAFVFKQENEENNFEQIDLSNILT